MSWAGAAAAAAVVLAASWAGTGAVRRLLCARAILDRPNERSSHRTPTPRGAGLAVIGVLLPAWALLAAAGGGPAGTIWPLLAGALGLAGLSWMDDLRGLGAAPRLAAQFAAVVLGLLALQGRGPVFQGLLPPLADAVAAGLLWLWFVNLFNFMDGIDGIAGTETVCIGAGVALVAALSAGPAPLLPYGLTAAAAALGFLAWNWHPARIFLGDVGSVPLGYLLGWLLLALAAAGEWRAALILPLYYLADATITLGRRLWRRERVWHAHRGHFYQLAVRRGYSHAVVVRAVLAADIGLIAAAAATRGAGIGDAALAAAAVVVGLLLLWLARGAGRQPG